jgi:hypothetical protein
MGINRPKHPERWLKFSKIVKSQSHDFDFDLTFWLFSLFFDFFFVILIQNRVQTVQKCRILTKWPFGPKRKRQNVFSRSPSKNAKSFFFTFFQISKKVMTLTFGWLDFSLKNWLSAQVCSSSLDNYGTL